MSCKYKKKTKELCLSCGRRKDVLKCTKLNVIIGRFTCRFCKYYERKEKKSE